MRELFCNEIDFVYDEKALLERLHCEDTEAEPFVRALELLEEARPYLKPAFAVKEFSIEAHQPEGITVNGCFFKSKIVAKKLEKETNVFAYIATSGRKICEFIKKYDDILDEYILDQIAYISYLQAMDKMSLEIENQFGIEKHIRLCPGSVIDWGVEDVKNIFILMEGLYQDLDVSVMSSGLIDPLKSTSGLFYATDEEFASCEICPRSVCESRTAPFDGDLHDEMVNM